MSDDGSCQSLSPARHAGLGRAVTGKRNFAPAPAQGAQPTTGGAQMRSRTIGTATVSAIGLGGMPMSIEGRPDEDRSLATIHAALDAGVTLIDTADAYHLKAGEAGHNERLISKASIEQIDTARHILGEGNLASVQNHFSAAFRSSEDELRHCADLGIAFLAYAPLGGVGRAAQLGSRDRKSTRLNSSH